MTFEFAKYTEVTDFAMKMRPSYKEEGYIRFFACADVYDFWFIRILSGVNEDYEQEEGSYLLERNKIEMERKGQTLSIATLSRIIKEDDGSSWDIEQSYDLSDLIDMIDGGYGINELKTA